MAAVESLRAANQQLEARNTELMTRTQELAAQVAVLADRLSLREEEAGQDSESCSKPPSTDNIATRQTRGNDLDAATSFKAPSTAGTISMRRACAAR